MNNMFDGAYAFNRDLTWDTSSVTSVTAMFRFAESMDGRLFFSDLSGVTSLNHMFNGAMTFSGRGLNTWNVSPRAISTTARLSGRLLRDYVWLQVGSTTQWQYVFQGAHCLDADLSDWDTGAVISMLSAFQSLPRSPTLQRVCPDGVQRFKHGFNVKTQASCATPSLIEQDVE